MSNGAAIQPKVFLSHSHTDRETATELHAVLVANGADSFLDQDLIEGGDVLPERLEQGISWSTVFVLIWSLSARSSQWVQKEWNLAYDQRKRIVPYCLDDTTLPNPLDALVYVSSEDRNLAYSNLLTAVFGRAFEPPSGGIFAGTWQADFNAFGVADGTAIIELRKNGQLVGNVRVGQGGVLGAGLQDLGLGNILNTEIPINGRWTYEPGTRVLELNTTTSGFGTQGSDTVRIIATGSESGPIRGQDLSGRTWVLQRMQPVNSPNPQPVAAPQYAATSAIDSAIETYRQDRQQARRSGDEELAELTHWELLAAVEAELGRQGYAGENLQRELENVVASANLGLD